jgi:hypothetical protein
MTVHTPIARDQIWQGTSRKVLSEDEIETLYRDGYVKPKFRLSPADLKEAQDMAARLIADNPHVSGVPYTHMHAPGYSRQNLKHGTEWYEFMTKPVILDLVEDLIGPDIVLWSSALFHKREQTGGRVNFHRDAEHFPITPLVTPNIWIALTPSTVANGCVRFVPGSHISQERGEHVIKPEDEGNEDIMVAIQLKDAEKYEALSVPLELEPGEMYIADPFVIHGSGRNNTPIARTGYSMRYFPTTSIYEHAEAPTHTSGSAFTHFTGRPLYLVRGEDKSGHNDFSIGHKVANGGLMPPPPVIGE